MANNHFRTPIIKPRSQGGTFYTFGSAAEDVGLNINESSNRVELSHYVLLDIPQFSKTSLNTHTTFPLDASAGDYTFAEAFQDYVLNEETVIRNNPNYNIASNKTVSEQVFWNWIFKTVAKSSNPTIITDGKYKYQSDAEPIAKAFGRISASSQRSDSYGIYNETFVQIPSSYGTMRVLFTDKNDENFSIDSSYYSTNGSIIENISSDEYNDSSILNATGISAQGIFDGSVYSYKPQLSMNVVFDIDALKEYYGDSTITYDDIASGIVQKGAETNGKNYTFNAILVYYSIYTPDGSACLATNAYGVYILDKAAKVAAGSSNYYFFTLNKNISSPSSDGNSFSFRINIKPSSAYSGDIKITDNSTPAFSSSEDFDNVIRYLNTCTVILKENNDYLSKLVDDNKFLRSVVNDLIYKVDDLENRVAILEANQ